MSLHCAGKRQQKATATAGETLRPKRREQTAAGPRQSMAATTGGGLPTQNPAEGGDGRHPLTRQPLRLHPSRRRRAAAPAPVEAAAAAPAPVEAAAAAAVARPATPIPLLPTPVVASMRYIGGGRGSTLSTPGFLRNLDPYK